jgi:hypothetical protein
MKTEIREVATSQAARFHAFSSSPEEKAWAAMEGWAGPKGYLVKDAPVEIYGYNNPNPSAGSPNYGYEFLVVAEDLSGAPEVVTLTGGKYLIAPFEGDDPTTLAEAWKALVEQAERDGHSHGTHQWLEKHTPPGLNITLYLPIQ